MTTKRKIEETDPTDPSLPKFLYRIEGNKVIGGVAGGLGEYFGFDPTLIRVIFIFLAIFGGSGVILYIILWAIMPSKSNLNIPTEDAIKENMHDIKNTAKRTARSLNSQAEGRSRSFWAILLLVIGMLFLINNYGIFDIHIEKLWPVLLILLGLLILRRR